MLGKHATLGRSKQLYHLALEGGHCELSRPAPALLSYIDYYWLLGVEAESLVLDVVPDTAVDLVLCPEDAKFAALYFPVEEKFSISLSGPILYAGVCFRSETVRDILGHDMQALDRLNIGAQIISTLNIATLLSEVQGIRFLASLTKQFDAFWLSRLKQRDICPKEGLRISHQSLIKKLEESLGEDNIATVCAALGISARQLRRVSRDMFGISPKKLQKVLRLQAALDELFQCEASQLRDLYYDDSHRIKELKRLTGCTPGEIRRMAEKYNKR